MDWKVPLFDTNLGEDEYRAVERVLRSGWLTMGGVTSEFEAAFADFLGVRHALAVSSCTAALHMACLALEIEDGEQVIVPSLTFVAAANTVCAAGAQPVFADIESVQRWHISARDVEQKITPQTRAIQVMHYGGYACDMPAIEAAAAAHELPIIEDCAHCPGARANGRLCGSMGAIGCFSFFSNKNLTTGEGGMIVTNDDSLAEKLRLIRSHGMTTLTWERSRGHAFSYDVRRVGLNYRIDEMRSALGLVQLGRLHGLNQRRKELAFEYRSRLSGIEQISLPFGGLDPDESVHHIFPILLAAPDRREEFMSFMKAEGIQTSIHYPPVHRFSCYAPQHGASTLPITEDVAGREVTIPFYPAMSSKDIAAVVEAIERFYASGRAYSAGSFSTSPVRE